MPLEHRTRPATVDDIDAILANLGAGFRSYVEFAPDGWTPPEPERERNLEGLRRPGVWARLALVNGDPAGHVAFLPARGDPFADPEGWRDGDPAPGLAHLWQLFVLPEHWGGGIAAGLLDEAVEAMREQGYERARLFTPVAHVRARRFYEREGWRPRSSMPDPDLGLELVEYRITLA